LPRHALGYGGFWRTGDAAYDDHVKQSFGLTADDEIVGFLYLGHIETPGRPKTPDPVGVVEEWTGLPAGHALGVPWPAYMVAQYRSSQEYAALPDRSGRG